MASAPIRDPTFSHGFLSYCSIFIYVATSEPSGKGLHSAARLAIVSPGPSSHHTLIVMPFHGTQDRALASPFLNRRRASPSSRTDYLCFEKPGLVLSAAPSILFLVSIYFTLWTLDVFTRTNQINAPNLLWYVV